MANNGDLKLVISQIVIDTKTALPDINAAIAKLSKQIEPLNVKLNIDTSTLNKFITSVEKMKKISDDQNKIISESQDVYRKLDGSITTVTQRVQKNGEILQKTKTIHDQTKKAMQNEGAAAEKLAQSIQHLNKAELDSIQINRNKANVPTGYTVKSSKGYQVTSQRLESDGETLVNSKAIINYKKEREDTLKQIEAIDRAHYMALKDNNARIEAAEKQHTLALQQNDKRNLDFKQSIADKQAKIDDLMRRFGSDSGVKTQIDSLNKQLSGIKISKLDVGDADYKSKLRDIDIGLKNISATARTASSHTMSMNEQLKVALSRVPLWAVATTAIYAPLAALRSGVTYVSNLDSALTDLQKVTDETAGTYDRFLQSASRTANEVGALTLDVVRSTTEWSKLGYTLQQAQQLAKQTTIYQNVGDISNAAQASEDLISAIKGFGIEVDAQGQNITHLVDVYNEVGRVKTLSRI